MPRSAKQRQEQMSLGAFVQRAAKAGDPEALRLLNEWGSTRSQGSTLKGSTPRVVPSPEVVEPERPAGSTLGVVPSGRRTPVVSSVATNGRGEESQSVVPLSVVPSKQNSNQPPLFADAQPAPLKRNLIAPFVAAWEHRFGRGSATPGRLGKAVRPLLDHHRPEIVLEAFCYYLEATQDEEVRFVTVERFRNTYSEWEGKTGDLDEVGRGIELLQRRSDQRQLEEKSKRERGRALMEAARRGELDAE